ncbi:LysR family transcriptional regulator [Pantoea cypripedii]|uniref:Transcriptional regulator n=1 Tax=Pantoea cypripedii TaxID=55209 RepID=A0A1X1EKC5_PANCY|nr:LysR family transcriptional regulator [Pantoea cypripedii]MBP2198951.1 DNA-binding transcriptional LysR family regulator [Pantoea cypripedii]ORM89390.1 transcriptional regulator [Pantoea cypripedii]
MERMECDRMFIAVMETGSFTAAAQRLGTSHGQASKLISRLEKELGTSLFRRSTRSLSSTEVGKAYYERVRQILTDYDELSDTIRHTHASPSGILRISAPVSFGSVQLAKPLVNFAEKFPEIELDVSFSDRPVNVVDEGFDLAIRIGNLTDSTLIARKLSDIRIVLVASPEYLSQHAPLLHQEQLSQHECIVDTNFRDPWHWPFRDEHNEQLLQAVHGRLKFSNAEVCLQAACSGLGITRLPSFIVSDALKQGLLVPVLERYEAQPLGLFAVFPPAKYLAHKSRVLIDFMVNVFAGQPEWDKGWQ